MTEWISVKDRMPPRDRNILIYDELEWIFVGSHERNYLTIELPLPSVSYTKKQEKDLLEQFLMSYRAAIDPFMFRCITFDCCQGRALYWSELPLAPSENNIIWNDKNNKRPEYDEETLIYHNKLGVIEAYGLAHSDTYSCKALWEDEDVQFWMPLPSPPKD